jgi:hypothetical protein
MRGNVRLAGKHAPSTVAHMKFSLGLVAGLLFLARSLVAETGGVTVEVTLNQDQFLPTEAIEVAAKITNLSGQALALGQDDTWLQFFIVEKGGAPVAQIATVPITGEFTLESSLAGTKRVNLTPYFAFRKIGQYQVKAVLSIPQWNTRVSSAAKPFEIIRGSTLRSLRFGVPPADGDTNRPPEVRQYLLQQANYLKDNLSLYVRITDQDGSRTLGLVRAGRLTSFSKPEGQLDIENNLHLLFQNGARSFLYSVIAPSGEVLVRQTHEIASESRPKLRDAGQGRITVSGGVRRLALTDLPAPQTVGKAEE